MTFSTLQPGTFEFTEAKIRRDAEGTAFGGDLEWLCQWSDSNLLTQETDSYPPDPVRCVLASNWTSPLFPSLHPQT